MASFPSPSAQPKMHVGKANRRKRTAEQDHSELDHHMPREYPLTDEFASHEIPGFATRCANTNNKSGFNVVPAHPPAGRLAQPPPYPPCRGYGREVGRDENETSADTATANKTKLVKKEGKNPGIGESMLAGARKGAMAGIANPAQTQSQRNPILTQKQSPGY